MPAGICKLTFAFASQSLDSTGSKPDKRYLMQGLLPLLAFFTRTDDGIVRNDVGQTSSSVNHRQENPMPAASADPAHKHRTTPRWILIRQNRRLLHQLQKKQGQLPLLAHSQALMTAEMQLLPHVRDLLHLLGLLNSSWPSTQKCFTARWSSQSLDSSGSEPDKRYLMQGLLPLLAIFTSTDGGIVRNDVRQNSRTVNHRQTTQCLLPLLTLLTSTDQRRDGYYIWQNRSLLHQRQKKQSLLPLLASLAGTDDG